MATATDSVGTTAYPLMVAGSARPVQVGAIEFPIGLDAGRREGDSYVLKTNVGAPRLDLTDRPCGDCERHPFPVTASAFGQVHELATMYACQRCWPELF